jgi:hypothetical protein
LGNSATISSKSGWLFSNQGQELGSELFERPSRQRCIDLLQSSRHLEPLDRARRDAAVSTAITRSRRSE